MTGRRLQPASVLVLRYHLEQILCTPRSLTGVQLDQLRTGYRPGRDGAHPDGLARLRLEFAHLVRLCRDLTPEEEQVSRLRYGTPSGAIEGYERLVPACEVQRQTWGDGVVALGTVDGEEQVQARGEVSLVRGRRARWRDYAEIAEATGLSAWQVQRRVSSALDKVRRALKAQEGEDG